MNNNLLRLLPGSFPAAVAAIEDCQAGEEDASTECADGGTGTGQNRGMRVDGRTSGFKLV